MATVVIAAFLLSSCYSYQYASPTQRGAINGAFLGGVAGALIGSADGNWGKGALIGSVVGGLAGAVYGHDQEHRYGFYHNHYPTYYLRTSRYRYGSNHW